MMIRRIFFLIIVFTLFSCEPPIVEKVIETHPDNAPKLVEYFQEIDGKEVLVEQKEFHPNGQFKMGGQFLNGKRTGNWEAYFEDGKTQSIGEFIDGERTGIVKVYFPTGKLYYEGQYENGKEAGHWKFYNEAGKLVNEKDF
jgi:antitoxin component YwqK of YwqJK toxin-antitoxin module